MKPTISVRGLKKSYKKNMVLMGVDFIVEPGTVFALLGSNGAGKTTTINILATLIKADEGAVTVNGYDVITEADAVRRSISLTGQFAAVDDVLSARENLELIGDLRHIENLAQTVAELLERFGLTDTADRRVATFSGGMRRRLDIAMGLIGDPPVIFFDEPTTGLDPEARNAMWQTIRTLANKGTTIFLTTQYLEEADELADKIALLHEGEIVASGTASELKKLVPGGLVELTFHDERQLERAVSLLQKRYNVTKGNDNLTLTVAAGASTTQLADLFILLRDAMIEPSDFSQKLPTLDDVFFKLTGNKEEKE
jgi:ABC-2 type transport system ATP-binding protein